MPRIKLTEAEKTAIEQIDGIISRVSEINSISCLLEASDSVILTSKGVKCAKYPVSRDMAEQIRSIYVREKERLTKEAVSLIRKNRLELTDEEMDILSGKESKSAKEDSGDE